MSSLSLAKEIRAFFNGEVETSAAVREEYSRDASLFKMKPEIVVFPKNTEDAARLVAFVAKKKQEGVDISLTARSAGTDMTGGPLSQSIVMVCTRYMNRVKGFMGDYITVEPGMYYRDLDVLTRKHGLFLPSYTASRDICAVGGMVANNAGGEKNIQYGKTERYVKKITMVLRDGRPHTFSALTQKELQKKLQEKGIEGDIYRKMHDLITRNNDIIKSARPAVSKNSSGYYLWNIMNEQEETFDLTKILVGSQGTFGIITDVTFQLIRPKPYSSLVVMFLKDTKRLGEVINHVMRQKPESFESYDDHTFKIAVKFFP
ncbi:MAG: FAD-binding oxidoreductase, partial [Patescibacteria group bacterium]